VTAEPLEATSLVELTVRRLREEILSGALVPGERIVEEQLTRRFGTSRAPLREALRVATAGAPRLTGNAAKMMVAEWPLGERPPSAVEQRAAPDIDWVAQLGAAAPDTGKPPKPLYLRAPDAQPQDAAQLARR